MTLASARAGAGRSCTVPVLPYIPILLYLIWRSNEIVAVLVQAVQIKQQQQHVTHLSASATSKKVVNIQSFDSIKEEENEQMSTNSSKKSAAALPNRASKTFQPSFSAVHSSTTTTEV